jgi:hypothetical protein
MAGEVVDRETPEKKDEVIENEDGSLSLAVETPEEGSVEAEEPKEEAPAAEKPQEEVKDTAEEERKRNAQAFYNLRNEIKKKDSEIAALKQTPKPTKTREEYEEELAKKPVSTIEEIVDARVREALEAERSSRASTDYHTRVLEESKARAIEKHPELENANSVQSQTMIEVLTQHPDWVSNPYGPVLAMVEMESLLKRRGLEKPAAAETRIPVSSMPSSRNIPRNTKTISLTKEQADFCRENNIDPKLYAQNMRFSSGVEV